MITEYFFTMCADIMKFIAGLFPAWTPPTWFSSFGDQLNYFMGLANGLAPWFNFVLAGTIVTAVISTWVICFTIKLVMRAASHAPVFGGAG